MKTSDLLKGVVTLDEYLAERLSEKKPMTNADHIRGMTDEELAIWLNCMQSNAYHCGEFGRTNAAYPFDNKAWLEWLKSPVKDGDRNG